VYVHLSGLSIHMANFHVHTCCATFRRLLEANGRGMWSTDDETIDKLRQLYSDADDLVEQVASSFG
jgi:cobalamin biosynthesis Mg chelatase CobN